MIRALAVISIASILACAAAARAATIAPPARPGQWTQLGKAVTSRAGKQLHFYRIAQSPHGLGVVATSSSSRPIKLSWQSYCEFQSDDEQTLEDQGVLSGVGSVTGYPSTFPGNTLCYVWVTVIAPAGATASAAISTA